MKEFNVSEVLNYSRNIEKESYDFYTKAGSVLKDGELKKIASTLADEELKDYNRINTLLEKASLTAEEMNKRIKIKQEDYDHLVATRELPADSTTLLVLETAYQRELKTESVYRTLISFTDLSEDIIDTFSDLMAQEKGHANRIQSLMKKYA